MAGRGTGTDRNERLKRARRVVRLASRVAVLAGVLLLSTLVGVQFAHVIGEDLAFAHQLSTIRSDIHALEKRRAEQQRELVRLRNPEGAVPEIHDRLRLLRPNEAIIFVSPAPSAASSAP
jgi:septal ring factor EnvC (AmiA/AmiB activator)